MSWAVAINDVEAHEIETVLRSKFDELYPQTADGVGLEFVECSDSAQSLARYAFEGSNEGRRFNISASGHVSDNDSESFVSVIVTVRKPEAKDDPAEN